ncbi:hypothetical protein C8J56DRAFT_974901 [Mycena floridula]|nr:hypothetical protein C8J56DRAFT_974901 [Mycena floridula]
MFKKLAQFATLATTFQIAAGALATGHYQIQNFEGRCFDFVPTSTNDYVPVVTTPCVTGRQSQIWNVIADNPFGPPTYIIQATVAPNRLISYASAIASSNIDALHQQIQLHANPPPSEDLLLHQVDATHWTLGDVRGGGQYTAWAARADASLAAPLTLENSGSSATQDPQQLFTFIGPL